jgi:hypothetical protein
MTDDRHSFSAPRPVFGLTEPTWEVDVFRDGVDHPIETLRIDAKKLPPRYGKKKKVVWQLPDDVQQVPKFAMDEKRRLLDLFKQQKKSRKKGKRGSANPEEDDDPESSPKAVALPRKQCPEEGAYSDENEDSTVDQQEVSLETPPRPPAPPLVDAPPGLGQVQRPPPGLGKARSTSTLTNASTSTPSDPSTSFLTHPSLGDQLPPGFGISQLKIQEPTFQYFSISVVDNIPVELAKLFMDTYYPSLTQDQNLLPFFCPDAQKSLSVGTAHAFCGSKEEIAVQLASLSGGSQWDVRGVVAQQGVAGSVILLLTGAVLTKSAPQPFTFSHSIALIRSSEGQYQIHNDALVIMTE